jgi:hypothetical protein
MATGCNTHTHNEYLTQLYSNTCSAGATAIYANDFARFNASELGTTFGQFRYVDIRTTNVRNIVTDVSAEAACVTSLHLRLLSDPLLSMSILHHAVFVHPVACLPAPTRCTMSECHAPPKRKLCHQNPCTLTATPDTIARV